MTSVTHAIVALLYDHDAVTVAGLGTFLCQRHGANVNVITNQFEKPTASLAFNARQTNDDGLLAAFVASREGIAMEEAEGMVRAFVADSLAVLEGGETVSIPEVGTLHLDEQGEIAFEACETCDFNGDAFGLYDLNPRPVYDAEATNTPSSVVATPPASEPKAEEPDGDEPRKKHGWLWLIPLLLLAGAVALWLFKTYSSGNTGIDHPVDTVPKNTHVVVPVDTVAPVDTIAHLDTIAPVGTVPSVDTIAPADTMAEPVVPVEIVVPPAEAKAFIVGGCFAVEQNALNLTRTAWEQGFKNAFVMRWGSMYYVCYDSYATADEAKAVLPEIMTKYNDAAWILTK